MKSVSVVCIVAVLLMASVSNAANLRYKGSGSWDDIDPSDGAGWQNGALPGESDTARFNWGNNTVTLDYAAPTIRRFQMGVDESGGLVVNAGGVLQTAAGNSKIGNNGAVTGFLTVNAGGVVNSTGWLMVGGNVGTTGILTIDGGTVNSAGHLWVASKTDSVGTVDITGGSLSVGGMIGIGTINAVDPSGGTGTVNVNDGGLLVLSNIHGAGTSIHPGSMLNLYDTGRIEMVGDFVGHYDTYIGLGLISGDDIVGNVVATYDAGADLTTVVVPEPATMILLGLGGLVLRRRRK